MHTLPFSQYPFRKGLQSFYTCTFLDMHTPSIGLYPSREGHRSFYPWTPAHFWTSKLHPLAHIPPGRGTGVFIHRPLHISGHGNSVHWPVSLQGGAPEFLSMDPISLQGGAPEFLSTDPCTFLDMETLSVGLYPSREGHWSFYPQIPAHFWTWKLHPLAHIPPGRVTGVFIHRSLHLSRHGNSIRWPISVQGGALEFLSTDPCTFPDMETPFVGPYPSREGHRSFYPQIPAHFQTWKLCPLAHIPPGRGTRVFIHRPLHISRHGNSVHWPVSPQGGAPEFLSMDPCTFPDMETPSVGPYPSREGHQSFYPRIPAHLQTRKLHLLAHIPPWRGTRVFIHRSLHIYGHRNSVHWPISLQGGAPEFLSTDPCTFLDTETSSVGPYPSREGHRSFLSTDPCTFTDMETPSIGPYPSREGHWSFYPRIPAHFRTWKLRPLACIPPGRGTGVFIHGSLHISRHGNSIHWPISLQGGALENLSLNPCTFPNTSVQSINNFFRK